MKKPITVVVLITGISLLSACGYTVEQLVKDDALRHKVLKDCATMGLKAKDDKNCRVAAEAQVKATGDSVKGLLK